MRGNDHGQCLTEETLTEYLEGSLDPALKAVSEVHLVACDGCREQLGYFMHLLGTGGQCGRGMRRSRPLRRNGKTIAIGYRPRLDFPAWFLASARWQQFF